MSFSDAAQWIVPVLLVAVGVLAFTRSKGRVVSTTTVTYTLTEDGTAKVRAHLAAGNKIAAIKEFRELTGAGLKDAKDAVEALERT